MTSPHATTATPTAAATTGGGAPAAAVPATGSPVPYDTGLLVLRLALGLTLAAHGSQKLFGWFDGGGLTGTAQFFESVGYPSGKVMAVVAGLSETLGGLGLLFGLLTPLAGAAVVGTMLNVVAVDWEKGFFGGIEYPLLLAAGAAALALAGPGRWAADSRIPVLRDHKVGFGAAAVVFGAAVAGVVLLVRS